MQEGPPLPPRILKCIGEETKTHRCCEGLPSNYNVCTEGTAYDLNGEKRLNRLKIGFTSYVEATTFHIVLKITNLATSAGRQDERGGERANGAGEGGERNQIYERKLRRRRSQNEPQTANKKWTELLFRGDDDRGGI